MGIIRQINAYFAVPDMRNLGTAVRILSFAAASVFLLPLVSESGAPYFTRLLAEAKWIVPVVALNGIIGYFTDRHLVRHPQGAAINAASCLIQLFITDFVVMGTRDGFLRHLLLYTLGLLFLMYVEANRLRALSPAVSEARLTALTARIRPHFLFNSLNAAISLIRLRPYDAETLLENLANLFRAQLREGTQYSTLGQEIEWAQEYIAIEQIRMGTTACRWTGCTKPPTTPKPPSSCCSRCWKTPFSTASKPPTAPATSSSKPPCRGTGSTSASKTPTPRTKTWKTRRKCTAATPWP